MWIWYNRYNKYYLYYFIFSWNIKYTYSWTSLWPLTLESWPLTLDSWVMTIIMTLDSCVIQLLWPFTLESWPILWLLTLFMTLDLWVPLDIVPRPFLTNNWINSTLQRVSSDLTTPISVALVAFTVTSLVTTRLVPLLLPSLSHH